MIKHFKRTIWLGVFTLLVLSVWLAYYAIAPLKLQPKNQEISIQAKSGLRSIAQQLVAQGVLKEPWRFILLAKLLRKEQYLQAGNITDCP